MRTGVKTSRKHVEYDLKEHVYAFRWNAVLSRLWLSCYLNWPIQVRENIGPALSLGKAFPEFICGCLCCVLLSSGLTSENEEGPHSSETPCSRPSITRPSMWRSVPDRLPPSQGIKQNLTPPVPLKECLGNVAQSMHAVVRAQRWEGTESLIPTMIVFLESMRPTSRY